MKTITVRFESPNPDLPYTSYLRNGSVTTTGFVLDAHESDSRPEGVVTLRAITSRGKLASGGLQLSGKAMDDLAHAWLRLRHETPSPIHPFADDGDECPACGSWDISGDDVSIDAGEAIQEMSCNECQATWVQVYASLGYSDLVRDEEAACSPT